MSEIKTAEQYLVQRVMDLEEENDALAEAVEDLGDALELIRCHEASLEEELDGMAAQLRARADYDEVCEQRDRYADLWIGSLKARDEALAKLAEAEGADGGE